MDPGVPRTQERELIEQYAAMAVDNPARAGVREALIVIHQPLVRHLAQRYTGRGEPLDDLIQAGSIGLIHAVDRFDPQRSSSFTSFAIATVLGEIRKHFRDRTWSIRVPRRMQELSRSVTTARAELEQTLHRSPTVNEIAEHLGTTVDEVLAALEAAQAYATHSLDAPAIDGGTIPEAGGDDHALADVLNRFDLAPALALLDPKERQLLTMRFVDELSQVQMADQLGVDQSQVSRRLAHTLLRLRRELEVPST